MARYTRQRLCVLSVAEKHSTPVAGPISGIPGASLHTTASAVISRRIVMDAPYDPLFKDTQKGVPHARFDGATKVWYVEVLNMPDAMVLNVVNHLTGPVFLTGLRDRQFSVEVSRDLMDFARPFTPGTPCLFTWNNAAVTVTPQGSHIVACGDIPQLLQDMGLTVGAAPPFVPAAPYQPSPAANAAAVKAQRHRPPPAPSSAPTAIPEAPTGLPEPLPEPESTMTEADEVALSGSYGEMDLPADVALADLMPTRRVADAAGVPTVIYNTAGEPRTLYAHQRTALACLNVMIAAKVSAGGDTRTRLIVAHDPGLGKTTTAVAFSKLHPMQASFGEHLLAQPIQRIVVVCPERARSMWAETYQEWTGRPCFRYGVDHSAARDWCGTPNGVLVVGYSSIIRESFVDKLGHAPFDGSLLVVDEAHYLSNDKSKRSRAVREIAKRFLFTLMLTGTPMLAHPIELFPLLNLADAGCFPSYWRYATRYAGAHKTKFGWDVKGASNLPELTKALAEHMHRVRKAQADLPAKRRVLVPIDIEDADHKDLEDAVAQAAAGLALPLPGIPGAAVHAAAGAPSQLAVSGSIRQIVYDARRDETLEWIVDWAKAQPDRKLVVFAWNKAAVADLVQGMTGALDLSAKSIVGIDGDMPIAQRDAAVKRFNTDPSLRFLVATIASAGTVYDMHKQCCDGVFVQCDWTPGTMVQAEDRLGREPGGDAVTWYYLAAAGTVDERILKVLLKKQATFTQVIDGGTVPADYAGVLSEILQWKAARDAARAGRKGAAADQEAVA